MTIRVPPAPMLRGWRARLVWTAIVVELAAMTLAFLVIPPVDIPWPAVAAFFLIVVASGSVGALIAKRQPGNTIGWILCGLAAVVATTLVQLCYVFASWNRTGGAWPGTTLFAWVGSWTLAPVLIVMTLLIPLLFPDGRLPSPRWRPALWGLGAVAVILTIPSALQAGPLGSFQFIQNPMGIEPLSPLFTGMSVLSPIAYLAALITVIAGARSRYRHGSEVERLQLRWFGASMVVIGLLVLVVLLPLDEAGWIIALLGLALLPISIGVAILRYRLYDIDRIISRTIGWAVVTGILVVTFAGAIVGLQALLAPVTQTNTLAVAASTLVVFALFQPVRRRVQSAVDRRFNRSRYDAERTVDALAGRLRNEVDLVRLRSALVTCADETVRPATTGLWLRGSA